MLTVQTMNYLHSGFHRVAPVTGWRAPLPSLTRLIRGGRPHFDSPAPPARL